MIETRLSYQTAQQMAAVIKSGADSLPGPLLTMHRHSPRSHTVLVYWGGTTHILAATRAPALSQEFATADAALNACKRILELVAPDEASRSIRVWL